MNLRTMRRLILAIKGCAPARLASQVGQSMVLVALMLFAFIALLAVILDGGNAYLQRRNAQTAADAGAMAGARELCVTGDVILAEEAANDYATNRNRALEADVFILGGEVEVTTRIPFQTFFGGLLGRPSITSSAIAAANCFAPSGGVGVLPVAWNCNDDDSDGSCDVQFENDDGIIDISELYIIMNSRKTGDEVEDPFCLPAGTVNCDLDGDGDNELLVGGNRSWLDLDGGGGGASFLIDWIENGFPTGAYIHTWYAGQAGVANSIFKAVEDFVIGEQVLLPVFNAISMGLPPYPYDDASDTTEETMGASTTYYHVISFSIFVPTCVHWRGSSSCLLSDQYRAAGSLGPSDKTIEGYFVEGFVPGLGGKGEIDAGAYTLYLTR